MGCASSKDSAGDQPAHGTTPRFGAAGTLLSDRYRHASHHDDDEDDDAPVLQAVHPDPALESSSSLLLPTPGDSSNNVLATRDDVDDDGAADSVVTDGVHTTTTDGAVVPEPEPAAAAKRWRKCVKAAHANGINADPAQFLWDNVQAQPCGVDGGLQRRVKRWLAEVQAAPSSSLADASTATAPPPPNPPLETEVGKGDAAAVVGGRQPVRLTYVHLELHTRILRQGSVVDDASNAKRC